MSGCATMPSGGGGGRAGRGGESHFGGIKVGFGGSGLLTRGGYWNKTGKDTDLRGCRKKKPRTKGKRCSWSIKKGLKKIAV